MEMKIKLKGSPIELVEFYNKLMELNPSVKVDIETDNTKRKQILNTYSDYLKSLNLDPDKFQYDKERNTGYFGMIEQDDFISGEKLSELVKFEKGKVLRYDTLWAVFYYHGKIAITPIKPIRYNVSWDDIDELGLVDGSFNRLDIKGIRYSIYLHTGDVEVNNTWDELLSRLHIDSKITPIWDNMTDIDLNINWEACKHGTATWCQETSSGVPTSRTHRGNGRLAFSGRGTSSYVSTTMAWRPLLILN